MGRARVKDDELRDAVTGAPASGTQMEAVVDTLANALGITLKCLRIDEPFYRFGEERVNRFYCLAVEDATGQEFRFPRTKNPNEIKRTVATITDLIHMGFLKLEQADGKA